jgi:hypothetical protein
MKSDPGIETYFVLSLTGIVAALGILALSQVSATLYAQELEKGDYSITDFGLINSDTAFITVQGRAGGSYDASLGDEGYQAYVFRTDKGNFMITVAQGAGSTPYYSIERLLTNDLMINSCLITGEVPGEPRIQGHAAVLLGRNLGLASVNDVYAIQVSSDDPDNTCKTGDHVSKIISYMTK